MIGGRLFVFRDDVLKGKKTIRNLLQGWTGNMRLHVMHTVQVKLNFVIVKQNGIQAIGKF